MNLGYRKGGQNAIGPAPQAADAAMSFAQALGDSDSAVLLAGADGSVVHVNRGYTRMLGHAPQEIVGRSAIALLAGPHTDAEQLDRVRSALARVGGTDAPGVRSELLLYARSGRPIWISATINPVANPEPHGARVVAVLTDITQTKIHEQLQHQVLEAIVRDVPLTEVMALLCREVERLAPEIAASVLAVDDHQRLRPLAAPSLPASLGPALDGLPIGPKVGSCGTAAWRGEPVLVLDIATDPLWEDYRHLVLPLGLVACWSSPIKSSDGQVLGTFGFYFRQACEPSALHRRLVEVSSHLCALLLQRETSRARIHRLAHFDALTGLPSRPMVSAQATRLLHEATRDAWPVSIVFLDLDRFKQINDAQGHAVGDRLLCEAAQRLQTEMRETDVLGRFASDEFVAVLPRCGAQQAAGFAERLGAALARPVVIDGITLQLSASLGVAVFPEDGNEVETLLRHAHVAMHQAKADAPGSFRFFRAEMNAAVRERAMLEADLRNALRNGGLELHYQPQVASADTSRLRGVEALLRWQHPVLGAVPPMRFVALAEECGLIRELGHWVLQRACSQMADWRERGIAVPRVAVNMSPSNFKDAGLPDRVAAALQSLRLSPDDLMLEITEGVMLDSDEEVLTAIDAIRAQGVQLSMDDFGTGYSSLGHLHRLPISELKLDRSFVRDLETSTSARALTASVLRIADSLHMEVVAEGVETEAQHRFLAERGCATLQGYLFARALSAPALEAWLAGRSAASAAARVAACE
jgi:diguanylate cyclase (GGDEF)-like protein/PAS domain S-box-containing protein